VLFAAGKATAAGSAAALAEGVLQTMGISRFKVAVAAMLGLAVVGTGTGVLAFGGRPAEPEAPKKTGPAPKAEEKAGQLRKKATARRDLARSAFEGYLLQFQFNMVSEQTVNLWSRRLLQAQLDLSDRKADRDAALRAHQDRLKKVDEIARARLDLGGSPQTVRSAEQEFKNHETVLQDFMNSKASPEQVCQASARLLMAQQVFRKQVIKTTDIKDPNAKPALDRIEKELGIDLRVENSEFVAHLDRMQKVEAITRARENAGRYSHMESETAAFYRLQAEEWLAQKKTFSEAVLNPGADKLIGEKQK